MAEEYNVQDILTDLKAKEEMDPDKHDGCYELMRETIKAYAKLDDISILDYKDLNLVYLTTVGTWKQGVESKKNTVNASHLLPNDKEHLAMLWDEIWEKAGRGEYTNYEMDAAGNRSIGMFGTGFFSFENKTTDAHAQSFIKMCVDIFPMTDDIEMFDRAAQVLTSSFQGMRAASASMVLHYLKPYTFPVLNSNMGNRNIFEVLGVDLVKRDSIETYIDNCRRIKAFRDQNFTYKNYRIFDMAAWKVKDYVVQQPTGSNETGEIIKPTPNAKIWLITWNKNNWNWQNFEEICEGTKAGQTFVESWACANSNPQIGDEVFLIKLGDQPRCLIGHGTVKRAQYEKDHYDPAKAAEGKREKAIDVEFDRVINYEKDKYVDQAELNAKCGAQYWSPQSSGIEIKQEVIPTLRMLWTAVTKDSEEWWPSLSEYDPGLTIKQYHDLFLNEKVVKRSWLEALYEMYQMPEHLGTCKQMGERYGYAPSHYISYLSTAASNIAKAADCPTLPREEENARYWPVLFQGKHTTDKSQGSYCWKMRGPVIEAVEMLIDEGLFTAKENGVMARFDHNMILYGPPGTGKTYNSVIYAVAICESKNVEEVMKESYPDVLIRYRELQDAGRIAFTTFHQSYGYEEFIEGIKPKMDADTNTLGYTIEDGVFKNFCKCAKAVKVQAVGGSKMKENPRIWGMILGGTSMTDLKKQCFANSEIRLGWSEVDDDDVDGDFVGDEKVSWNAKHMVSDFKNTMEIGDIVVIEKSNKSIDAIGVVTGDYEYDESQGRYPRKRSVEWLVKDIDQDMVPFLPNGRKQLSRFSLFAFDYIGMETISQILNENTNSPIVEVEQESKPYVFIIDEINRGNISKIFGELITLIEDTKRAGAAEAMEAILPYSGEVFSVPKNVYILGTMNTADRSIALMDTALRRRFEFKEMMPDPEVLERLGVGTIVIDGEELNVAAMLDMINRRIEYLFDREHTIGHAFFTKLADDPSLDTLAGIFEKNVIPLLQEYFYEDYEKIQLILGDNAKDDEFKFILDKPLKIKDIFNGNPDIDLPEKGYEIQHDAFHKLASYKLIGKDL